MVGKGWGEREDPGLLIIGHAVVTISLLSKTMMEVSTLSMCPYTWDFQACGRSKDDCGSGCFIVLGLMPTELSDLSQALFYALYVY